MQRRSVITVGNFDGVHLGHRALLQAARALGERHGGAQATVLAFTDHPLTKLRPEHAPPKLMDIPQRMAALLDAGADRIEWLEPDERVLGLEPGAFVERVMTLHKPVGWVEGPDFRFGRGRAGDVQLLRELGRRHGFEVSIVEPVEAELADGAVAPVSSSLVRWLVAQGRVADAARCLGRAFAVCGEVVRGERRGRAIGFPTANLDVGGRLLPGDGVYSGCVEIEARVYPAAISVGRKPTFGRMERAFEAYLHGFDGDLYGQRLEVRVHHWLRDQSPFPDAGSLVVQMERDVRRVLAWESDVASGAAA